MKSVFDACDAASFWRGVHAETKDGWGMLRREGQRHNASIVKQVTHEERVNEVNAAMDAWLEVNDVQ